MSSFAVLLLLSLFSLAFCETLPVVNRQGLPCASTCRLFLCRNLLRDPTKRNNGAGNELRGNGVSMGGAFCNRLRPLVDVSIGEALVTKAKSGDPFVPISSYSPAGLTHPFRKNTFITIVQGSGSTKMGRKKVRGNQNELMDDLCVTIPILSYRNTLKSGEVGPLITTSSAQDCISMRVKAAILQFELEWDSLDDIDFKVVEPTGVRLSRRRQTSPSGGRFKSDGGTGRCDFKVIPGETTRETVTYPVGSTPPSGIYTLIGRRFNGCMKGKTTLTMRAVLNGIVIKTRSREFPEEMPSRAAFFSMRITI